MDSEDLRADVEPFNITERVLSIWGEYDRVISDIILNESICWLWGWSISEVELHVVVNWIGFNNASCLGVTQVDLAKLFDHFVLNKAISANGFDSDIETILIFSVILVCFKVIPCVVVLGVTGQSQTIIGVEVSAWVPVSICVFHSWIEMKINCVLVEISGVADIEFICGSVLNRDTISLS